MNLNESLIKIFDRDLSKLEEEIKLYPTEESVWGVSGDIKNSGGNLCLHLCGNLQHFIGAVLGKTEYHRNRDLEFSASGIPIKELDRRNIKDKKCCKDDIIANMIPLRWNVTTPSRSSATP